MMPEGPNDDARLAALGRYDILDTGAEQGFDDLTLLAARICDAPVALISLVDRDRQWFKARVAFPTCQTDLDSSVCKFVLAETDVLVIPDLLLDPRTGANPLVTGEPFIRFYAGAPLRTPEGVTIGSLCVIDKVPRPSGLTQNQIEALHALARQVIMLLELRRKETERLQALEALSKNEARMKAILSTVPIGIVMTNTDGRIHFANDRAEEMFGSKILRAPDVNFFVDRQSFHGDGREVRRDEYPLVRVFSGEERPELECQFQGEDGRLAWQKITGGPVRDGTGALVGSLAAFVDIDEEKRAERELRRLNETLEAQVREHRSAREALSRSEAIARDNAERLQLALAAGAIVGTWFWEIPTDRFIADAAFARSFGLDAASCRDGLHLDQVIASVHPEDRAGLHAAIDQAVRQGGSYAHQYRTRRADGSYRWLEANGHVDHAPDGTPLRFPGVLIDVEERRAVEAERERVTELLRNLNGTLEERVAERTAELQVAEDALRQSQKMEAVGQLTGGLAHDFNNLLAGISGALELMQIRQKQGRFSDLDRYMAAAQGAAKRAAALTHRLLAFSRRQTLDPKPTDVNHLIRGIQELIQRTVGPAILIEVVGLSGIWPALVDPSQLENALLNLCINARDAMPDGGRITIETANKWLDERAARQHDMPEGQYLSLCVTDTGTGMPPDVIARVFEPFFTTKPIGEGTGLGLSMVYGFAKQSGGQVRIYSEVGKGTTVCVYLPKHYGEIESETGSAKIDVLPRSEQGETVLVVDDEPVVRMLITDILEDLGYKAIEAGDSATGLKTLQSDARIDLLITDVGLPGGMNGRQMADAGRVPRPNLKVLFITGYAENAVLGNGHLTPGMAILTKPFAVETMAARIRSMLESAGPIKPTLL